MTKPRIITTALGISLLAHAALFGALAMSFATSPAADPLWELPAGEAQGVIAYLAPIEVEDVAIEYEVVADAVDESKSESIESPSPMEPLNNTFTDAIQPFAPQTNPEIAREWLAMNARELVFETPTVQVMNPRMIESSESTEPSAFASPSDTEPEVTKPTQATKPAPAQGGTPGVTERPVPDARNKPPKYPASSRRAKETGTVLLHVLINANGQVEKLSILESSGFDALDRAALAAVQDWRFSPATNNGRAIQANVKLPIVFVLK